MAIRLKRIDLVKHMLQLGADVNEKGGNGLPALYIANVEANSPEIVKVLLTHPAIDKATISFLTL